MTMIQIARALAIALGPDPARAAANAVAELGFIEAVGDTLTTLLTGIPTTVATYIRQAQDEAEEATVYFRHGGKRTGLLVLHQGRVVAAFTFATPETDTGVRAVMRDLGVTGPESSSSSSSFSSPSPYTPPSPRSSSPFSSGYSPPGGSPAPLVHRRDLLWPDDDPQDESEQDPEDYLPGWSRT